MPRKNRIWYPEAMYHIMKESTDYAMFLSILDDVFAKYPFIIHSYCLMTNHIHLLIETKDSHISLIMKRLLSLYPLL